MVATLSITTVAPDRRLETALRDLYRGLLRWHLWWLLATMDVKQRYRRSRMGQFWITISMGVTVAALGLVYPLLFKISKAGYLPNVAVGFVVWNLISSMVTDGAQAFINGAIFLKQSSEPRSIYVYRVLARNGLIFLHNALIIVVVFILLRKPLTWIAPASLIGLALLFVVL